MGRLRKQKKDIKRYIVKYERRVAKIPRNSGYRKLVSRYLEDGQWIWFHKQK